MNKNATRHKASELLGVVYRESLLPKENPTLRACARWFHKDGKLKSGACTYFVVMVAATRGTS